MSNTGRKSRRRPQRKINQNMKEKLLILFGIVLLLLVILVLRITYINATSGSKYKKQVLSQAQQKYESQVLPAKRGDIYDKNGNILATSNKVYNVILDCKTVNSDEDYVEPTIRALNEVLGIDEETVRSLLADSRTSQSQYQVLTKQLSMDKKKEFEKYKAEDEDSGLTKAQAKERANIKGVWFEEDYLRSYPFNETACDTIGFALDRDVADIGLEGYYNSTLTGVDGRQYGYINDDSDVEQTIIAAVNGKSIQTSIDIGAQQIVEKYVNGFKEAMGAKNIGVIVENPSTGEIIAMDGGDRYDLNNPRDLSAVYTEDEIKAMNDVETVEALNGIPLVGVGIDAAVLYSQKGLETTSVGGVKTSMKTDYIDVPVNLKWKFGLPIVKAYLAAGPYIGFRVGGDKFWDIPGSVADQVKAKNFSAGLNFGAGVELISHLQVGFNYGLGLTDNYSIEKVNLSDGAGKNRGWSITAAILF